MGGGILGRDFARSSHVLPRKSARPLARSEFLAELKHQARLGTEAGLLHVVHGVLVPGSRKYPPLGVVTKAEAFASVEVSTVAGVGLYSA
jgi:hypothetical protein